MDDGGGGEGGGGGGGAPPLYIYHVRARNKKQEPSRTSRNGLPPGGETR